MQKAGLLCDSQQNVAGLPPRVWPPWILNTAVHPTFNGQTTSICEERGPFRMVRSTNAQKQDETSGRAGGRTDQF